jgi:hypothetical protein
MMSDAGIAVRTPQLAAHVETSGSFSALLRHAGPVLLVAIQLMMVLLLLRVFQIEPASGLSRILPLIMLGFLVHAALPVEWRASAFVILSWTAILLVTGIIPGATIIILGLVLFGICHLPVAHSTRVLLLLIVAAILAAFRVGRIELPASISSTHPGLSRIILPVLGSMFMFRLIIYMYDLRHEERALAKGGPAAKAVIPATWADRLAYFFILPNVCFLLFPIVDYRSQRRTYYARRADLIYQRGVWLMFLGVTYLLLYRAVYHFLVPSPEEVQGLGGIVRFMTASYLVYLRVVGQFHLVIGVLCLFGFDLPPVHRFYLLATSFTDFWRRARIEWKDFMVKIFYYPALVPLQRKLGGTPALVIATIFVFTATWMLHSYQWFWLRGDWRQLQSDAVFWVIIGSCVLVNSVLEARPGKQIRKDQSLTFTRYLVPGAKAVGMFVFMSVLWSYWSSPSFKIWLAYLSAAKNSGPFAYVGLVVGFLGAVLVAAFAMSLVRKYEQHGQPSRKTKPAAANPGFVHWRPVTVMVAAAFLLVSNVTFAKASSDTGASRFVRAVSTNALNAVDQERQDRGYYEVLLDEPRSTSGYITSNAAVQSDTSKTVVAGEEEDAEVAVTVPALSDTALRTAANESPAKPGRSVASAASDHSSTLVNAASVKTTAESTPPRTNSTDSSVTASAAVTSPAAAPTGNAGADGEAATGVGRRTRRYERYTKTPTLWENVPSFRGGFKGAPIEINDWGMRDRDYSRARPANTYRIALLGTSMTVGAGVPLAQTMETLIEDRLNTEGPGAPSRHYESLNFSVGGWGIMQNAAVVDEKVFDFSPNALMVGVFSIEVGRMTTYLAALVKSRVPVPYPEVRAAIAKTGATADMEMTELRMKLAPISKDMVLWSYKHIVEAGRRRGIPVVGVVLPEPRPRDVVAGRGIEESVNLAAAAGMTLLNLGDVYEGQPIDSLKLPGADPHWSVRGHKLIADKVFEQMKKNDAMAFKLGFK